MFTWLPRILPYMEQTAVESQIDWGWEVSYQGNWGPVDAVRRIEIDAYRCPSDDPERPSSAYGPTNYVACIGSEYISDNTQRNRRGIFGINGSARSFENGFQNIRDGTASTLLASECIVDFPYMRRLSSGTVTPCITGTEPPVTSSNASRRGYSWFYGAVNQSWSFCTLIPPNDRLTENHECEGWSTTGCFAARSRHPGGVNVALCDETVRLISETINAGIWSSLGTMAYGDREPIPTLD